MVIKLNSDESLETSQFKKLLNMYQDHIRHAGIDELERWVLINQTLKSPRLINLFKAEWEKPNKLE